MNIEWNRVTWYSKLGAVILFIAVLPVLTFHIGSVYQEVSDNSQIVIPAEPQMIVKAPPLQKLSYEPAVSTLTGYIVKDKHFDATCCTDKPDPSYIRSVAVLILETPVDVEGESPDVLEPGPPFSNISKIQLTSTHGVDINSLTGKKVTLTGTIFGRFTLHHFTEVLLDVQSAAEVPPKPPR